LINVSGVVSIKQAEGVGIRKILLAYIAKLKLMRTCGEVRTAVRGVLSVLVKRVATGNCGPHAAAGAYKVESREAS
jgi:hypothetical protein